MAALRTVTTPDMLVITYLQMTRREQFCPCPPATHDNIRIVPLPSPDVKFYRFLYGSVGESIRWRDRLLMSDAELEAALAKPGTEISVLYVGDVPAGYIELVNEGKATEIAYFGLRPAYHGRGLGKYLLSYGVDRAWQQGVDRVWVHTCNLDGPYALQNYVKRGFCVYKVHQRPMPERYQ